MVVDTNVIGYLLTGGVRAHQAERVLERDSDWHAPLLWRSEFRNLLITHVRHGLVPADAALEVMNRAEAMMQDGEHSISSELVLHLALNSRCSAYDCEFVALAQELGVPLVTADSRVLSSFPSVAISVEEFGS